MDLINNCTLVFDIDAIVLHTDPDTMGGEKKKSHFTHCHLCLTHFNVEIHYLYVSFLLQVVWFV